MIWCVAACATQQQSGGASRRRTAQPLAAPTAPAVYAPWVNCTEGRKAPPPMVIAEWTRANKKKKIGSTQLERRRPRHIADLVQGSGLRHTVTCATEGRGLRRVAQTEAPPVTPATCTPQKSCTVGKSKRTKCPTGRLQSKARLQQRQQPGQQHGMQIKRHKKEPRTRKKTARARALRQQRSAAIPYVVMLRRKSSKKPLS